MKLSQVLKDWPEKEELNLVSPSDYDMSQLADDTHKYIRDLEILTEKQDTAITSCDREIDEEALAKIVYGLKSVFKNPNHYSLKEQEKMALDDVETIISTMPTWLKRIEK